MKKPNLKKLNVPVTAPPRIDATPKTHGVNPQRKAVVFPPPANSHPPVDPLRLLAGQQGHSLAPGVY